MRNPRNPRSILLLAELGLGAPSYAPSGWQPIRQIRAIRGKTRFILLAPFSPFRIFRGQKLLQLNQFNLWRELASIVQDH